MGNGSTVAEFELKIELNFVEENLDIFLLSYTTHVKAHIF